ncbi:ankyrin repeat protein [Povalibacter uvarum]|uniref:Ankyrin repeat protein n=1 Tax=Povalibacter uvarum TaxID=732238 RepID=A0A841HTP2_9GAMM|nr:hypothetical protein [Povalibacter uvarum]MBB6095580.1 ankyrin repeat protein [Povalibacter uvarum]
MTTLPDRPDLEHLRKQAKQLLRSWRDREPSAFQRLRTSLPIAHDKSDGAIASANLRLHDMQSCIAREYGFASWSDLKTHVEWLQTQACGLESMRLQWLRFVYGGDIAGDGLLPRPDLAARLIAAHPDLAQGDPLLACAVGDEAAIRDAIARDSSWATRSSGPLNIPPIIAVSHSTLARFDLHREPLRRSLRLLLDTGADPKTTFGNRFPPASVEQPGDEPLTAIYGAAGKVHDPVMTQLLLEAGADPNDNESLYHSLDDPDRTLPCTKLLLQAGTRVPGTNALAKILDFDHYDGLALLLEHTPHGEEDLDRILGWAIYRKRSARHVRALLDAGANPHGGKSAGHSFYKAALAQGLVDVAKLLADAGAGEELSLAEQFAAACARVDEKQARALLAADPDLIASMSELHQKQLPILAMNGADDAVRLMVSLGWPIAARGGDIDGSALNWAVFRGNAPLANFLLDHGADWHEPHAYNSDVIGTLGWASVNEPSGPGDWVGCAEVLRAHGLPRATRFSGPNANHPYVSLLVDGRGMYFPDDVADALLEE